MLSKKYVSFALFSILFAGLITTDSSNHAYAAASITISPTSGPPGSSVTVTGSGFPASTVAILFDNSLLEEKTVTASGTFTEAVTIPADASVGTHKIRANYGTSEIPEATFTVTSLPATIALSPTSGPVGTSVTVTGSNFPVSTPVTIKFGSTTVATIPSTLSSSTSGTFSASFTVPAGSAAGSHTVTATVGGGTAAATFTVGGTLAISPTTGAIGTTITVSGSSFGTSKTITIKFGNIAVTTNPATVTTTASGTFSSATFAVPAGVTAGTHTVSATDGTITASATFTISSSSTISLSPTSGATGSSVSVSGSGFTASSSITVKFDSNNIATTPSSVTASASGTFSATITVPSATVGNHTISATDTAGKTGSALFNVIIPAVITLSPTAGQRSSSVTVSGSNFSPSSTITVKFDGTSLVTTPSPLTSAASGTFTATVTIPGAASAGSHTVTASDTTGRSGSATFTVSLGPVITLSPTSGLSGSEISVTGSNFTKNTEAKIKFGKITVATEPPKVVISAAGTMSAKFVVPAGVALGDHIVSVRDDTGRTGNATFTVKSTVSPSISLSPTSSAPGSTVTVTGSNFGTSRSVTVKYDDTIMITVTTTATGTFTATFSVPSTSTLGSHTISASDGPNNASATLNVAAQTVQPTLSSSSTSATPGSSLTVSGSGFTPGSTVTIKLDTNVLATSIATAGGSFTAAVNIPLTAAQGSHTLSASDGTNSSSMTLSIIEEVREKLTVSGLKLVDQAGSSVNRPSEGMQILIQSDLKNNLQSDQQFVYIVQVKDSGGATIMISWMSGTLPAGKQYGVAQSWLAEQKGNYSVDVFVWQSISNPVVLAPASKTTISVS